MKKRIISLVMAMFIIILSVTLTACNNKVAMANEPEVAASDISNFKNIEGEDILFYDRDTKIVYYIFSTSKCKGYDGYGYGYMAPYISENGNYCRYIDGKIVEIQ